MVVQKWLIKEEKGSKERGEREAKREKEREF